VLAGVKHKLRRNHIAPLCLSDNRTGASASVRASAIKVARLRAHFGAAGIARPNACF